MTRKRKLTVGEGPLQLESLRQAADSMARTTDDLRSRLHATEVRLEEAEVRARKMRHLLDMLLSGEPCPISRLQDLNPARIEPGSAQFRQLVDIANGRINDFQFDLVQYIYQAAVRAFVRVRIGTGRLDKELGIGAAYLLGVDYHAEALARPALDTLLSHVYVDDGPEAARAAR